MSLSNERISLREFTYSDWTEVHKYASQEVVCQYQPWGPNKKEDSKEFVSQAMKDAEREPRIRFVLAIMYKEFLIGAGEFNIKDFTNKVGEIGYIVNPDYWGKGVATEVAALLIDFGFKELNLHRIYATCDPRNIGSSRVLEKAGMVKEGRLREDLLLKDGWRDSFVYSVLEHEWGK
ncbi:GNAT family N-acetyltransferase [Jeotgalibacillus proteolyticus]|uniref:GNAT family N-acetyltransferase n=1 Tax=Jeotgalibacillus proteolyticus TaxID=2082395 RepID=A0A2S5GBH7_9BACL|nr:GNAT family protein [Jeotgalibacillus proteolyticus]PPA70360.1 GNAT family N-acetyltransferase [Jeotgalibacillus proteolyticus]